MYPNEFELQWSLLIVLYPFITGLVAGAFILASLERVFKVEAVRPTYRLSLLTALLFLLVAPLPLQMHLGHPERSLEMYLTPHKTSAMAMFGFVYLWYLMAVLLLEIWLEYRADIVRLSQSTTGLRRIVYRALTLGSQNLSPASRIIDDKVGFAVTVIGIPSAFLLHGYVGFIFGSVKANPWWSTPLMPVVFIFLRDGLWHRARNAALHGEHEVKRMRSTCAVSTPSANISSIPSSSISRWSCWT
jgi:Ni/Fe-hydrogenase subunit HybB-like protein